MPVNAGLTTCPRRLHGCVRLRSPLTHVHLSPHRGRTILPLDHRRRSGRGTDMSETSLQERPRRLGINLAGHGLEHLSRSNWLVGVCPKHERPASWTGWTTSSCAASLAGRRTLPFYPAWRAAWLNSSPCPRKISNRAARKMSELRARRRPGTLPDRRKGGRTASKMASVHSVRAMLESIEYPSVGPRRGTR